MPKESGAIREFDPSHMATAIVMSHCGQHWKNGLSALEILMNGFAASQLSQVSLRLFSSRISADKSRI
jgi:hypothetical protein